MGWLVWNGFLPILLRSHLLMWKVL